MTEESWEEDDLFMRSDYSNEGSPCESPTSTFMPKVIYLDEIEKRLCWFDLKVHPYFKIT